MRVLETDSWEVTTATLVRSLFSQAQYVGCDTYPISNVDVVGDAHRLEPHFDEPLDLVCSKAVFEDGAMPWIVSSEIAKLLRAGGYVSTETHFSHSSHQ
jgi:hypothetical protein